MKFSDWIIIREQGNSTGSIFGQAGRRPGSAKLNSIKIGDVLPKTKEVTPPKTMWVDGVPRPEDLKYDPRAEDRETKLPALKITPLRSLRSPLEVRKNRKVPKPGGNE